MQTFAADPNTFLAYIDDDGVIHQYVVVGWIYNAGKHAIPLTAAPLPKNAPAHTAVLHSNGAITDQLHTRTYESVDRWRAFVATEIKERTTRGSISSNPEDRQPPGDLDENDVAAIDKAVKGEVIDDPRTHIGQGPGMPGERQTLPGEDRPTRAPEPARVDLAAMATSEARQEVIPPSKPARASRKAAELPTDLGDLI